MSQQVALSPPMVDDDSLIDLSQEGEEEPSPTKLAVKIINTLDEDIRRFALQEYSLLKELCHPNVVRAVDSYETHATLHLVLELAPGRSLTDLNADPEATITEEQA